MSSKKIIRKLRLDEISVVDRPAQEGARMVIMKREGRDNMSDKAAAEALQKKLDELTAQVDDLKKAGEAGKEALAKAEAERDAAAVLAKMSDAEKGFMDDLDDDEKKKFSAMTPEQRKAAMDAKTKKKAEDDPVVHKCMDGTEIRKSDGAAVLALAKRADETQKENAALKAASVNEDARKRASTLLGNVPGEDDAKLRVAKFVGGIEDADERAKVEQLFEGANNIAKFVTDTQTRAAGHGADIKKVAGGIGGDEKLSKSEAEAKLDELAQAYIGKNSGTDYATAYGKVLDTPEGQSLYSLTV